MQVLEHLTDSKTDKSHGPHNPTSIDPRDTVVSEQEARRMLKILQTHFKVDLRVIFSSRMKSLQGGICYTRPVLLILPKENSGHLTEGRILHELTHALDLEHHAPRPHGATFRDFLRRIESAWYGRPPSNGNGGQ